MVNEKKMSVNLLVSYLQFILHLLIFHVGLYCFVLCGKLGMRHVRCIAQVKVTVDEFAADSIITRYDMTYIPFCWYKVYGVQNDEDFLELFKSATLETPLSSAYDDNCNAIRTLTRKYLNASVSSLKKVCICRKM